MNILNKYFHVKYFHEYFHVKYFFPVLYQAQCNNFRDTEILVVLSGDFCRYSIFSFM